MKNDETKLAVIANDIGYIKERVSAIEEKMEQDYMTRQEFLAKFDPVQKLVYGLVSLVLVAVVGALVSVVLIK